MTTSEEPMPTDILPNAVYTLKDTCEAFKISESTVRRWVKTGLLPARKIGRDYRFLGSDLLAALEYFRTLGMTREP